MSDEHGGKKLGWFLCWAVVFADIGTSLYYVPGIMFGQVHNLAGLFVSLTSIVFILLALKYVEITDRYPEGGGVVTVATHAFGPWFGALGGMFITVDYFLTASISSVSGFAYLNSIIHLGSFVVVFAIIGLVLLGILNVIGIKESAGVTAIIAVAAFIVDVVLLIFVSTQIGPEGWRMAFTSLTQIKTLTPWSLLTGFAGSFLAFSGLESISQLSPAMAVPRKKVAGIAMFAVIITICLTSPILTIFSTNLLTAKATIGNETILQQVSRIPEREAALKVTTDETQRVMLEQEIYNGNRYSERFISELGAQYGGTAIKVAVVITASILLLFAANTAIIGAYHVFMALSRQNFLPHFMQTHNDKFGTPHWSVLVAVTAPILILVVTKGNVDLLGELYAFGLLGAFALSSFGLDVVRWREGKRFEPMFLVGVATTGLVLIAWITNLYNKRLATEFGGAITLAGMCLAYIIWKYFPQKAIAGALTLTPITRIKSGQILVPVFGELDLSLFTFVAHYAKSAKKTPVLLYIREFTDVLQTVSENISLDEEAELFLLRAQEQLLKMHISADILYDTATDAGTVINDYRKQLKPALTILSPHTQSLMLDFLKGDIVETVMAYQNGDVLIHMGDSKRALNPKTKKITVLSPLASPKNAIR